MKKDIVYPVLLVIVSLVAGLAIGLVMVRKPSRVYRPRFEQREKMDYRKMDKRAVVRDMIFEKISDRLDLDEKQESKIRGILESSRNEAKSIIKGSKEKLISLKEKTNTQIRGILTKEQQVEFDKMIAEHKDRVLNFKKKLSSRFKGPGGRYPECKEPPMAPEEFPED